MDCQFEKGSYDKVVFKDALFNRNQLNRMSMNHVTYSNTEFIDSVLTDVSLHHALFSDVRIKGCGFKSCNIQDGVYVNSIITESVYSESSNLSRTSWVNSSIYDSDLSYITANKFLVSDDIEIKNVNFSHTSLEESTFQKMRLLNVNFSFFLT